MSDEELTPVSVGHLQKIAQYPRLVEDKERIDAIIDAVLDIEDQILKVIRDIKELKEGTLS